MFRKYVNTLHVISCIAIPSTPIDVKTTFISSSAVRLERKESKDKGGRTDLFYDIKCYIKDNSSTPCDSKVKYYPDSTGFKKNFVLASDLQALTSYEFQNVAKNGVSGIAGRENHMSISVMTKESSKFVLAEPPFLSRCFEPHTVVI